jgi:hypothetical protein
MPNPNYPSLALCQRLKELGWSMETEKEWYLGRHFGMLAGEAPMEFLGDVGEERGNTIKVLCPAPSVAEMLDVAVTKEKCRVEFGFGSIFMAPCGGNAQTICDLSMTRADQLATCLINLAERGEITL